MYFILACVADRVVLRKHLLAPLSVLLFSRALAFLGDEELPPAEMIALNTIWRSNFDCEKYY